METMKANLFASDLLILFLKNLRSSTFKYAIMRNYKLLPDANDSKDVDILVSPESFNRVIDILVKLAKESRYQLIWRNKLDYLEGFVFVKIDAGNIFSIKLDIFNGFKWRGCDYLDHEPILQNAMEYNGFNVPLKAHESFIMIVYYILYAKIIKVKYFESIYKNAINNWDEFQQIAFSTFSRKVASQIIEKVKNNEIDSLVTIRKAIVRETIRRNLRNGQITGNFSRHVKTEYFDRNRFGALIAFSGPDGAGKSTIVTPLVELFYSLGITGQQEPHHFLTKNIPSLHKLPGAPQKYAKQDYTKPYQAKTAGKISSAIRAIYYYFAFLADRLVFIKRELRANEIVIFDRYFIDMLTDPTRFRIGLNKIFFRRFYKTLPVPDLTLIILADKELILKRKEELTESKLSQLLNEYTFLLDFIPNCSIIDNNASIEDGQLLTCMKVFNRLEEINS